MHGVRTPLLNRQAAALGLPCRKLLLPEIPNMAAYEQLMASTMQELKSAGATASIFGDIFLEDLRRYHEKKLAELGLEAVFPLWGVITAELIREFIGLVGGFGRHRRVVAGNEREIAKVGRRLLPFGIEGGQPIGD